MRRAQGQGLGRREAQREAEFVPLARSAGLIRAKGRDGLLALFDNRGLTGLGKDASAGPDDWARASVRLFAGLDYREKLERASAGIGSQLQERVGSPGQGVNRTDLAVYGAAQTGRDVLRIERELLVRYPGGRELRALRAIAGEGRTAASLSSGGRNQRLTQAALLRALDFVAIAIRAPGAAVLTTYQKRGTQTSSPEMRSGIESGAVAASPCDSHLLNGAAEDKAGRGEDR